MYKIIDLFCGIGGFSYGFEMTKCFKTVLGVDCWNVALDTFSKNHPGTKTELIDVKKLDQNYLKKYINKTDVIIAGPPCQGFSMSGKRDIFDVRNSLFKEVIRIVSIVKPKVVVIENVVGLLSMTTPEGNLVSCEIKTQLDKLGYAVECNTLNAADYGVPQFRKRVVFIACQKSMKKDIMFPSKTHGTKDVPFVTVGEALDNIPNEGDTYLKVRNDYQKLMAGTSHIYNHDVIAHSPLIVQRMHSVPQGGNWKNIPIELGQGGGKHSNNYRRLKNDEPSITIKHVSKSMIIHPIYDRTPTIREVARLQSFDDNFIITGNKYDQHQQLANAVPPLLGRAIARSVLELLKK